MYKALVCCRAGMGSSMLLKIKADQVINENMLPSSYTGTDTGRATSGAAMALLGKIYRRFHWRPGYHYG